MNFSLQTTRKTGFSAFILSVCLFSAQFAFSQHRTWDGGGDGSSWSDAANWSGDAVPIATDSVTIIAGANVIVTTTPATAILKLKVFGSTGSQGKVTINSGVTLTVNSNNALSPQTSIANNAALMLLGGIIENNGTMAVTGRQALDAIRFGNPSSGTVSSTYMGTGTLNCNTASSTGGGGGGASTTGSSIVFAQTDGTATFTLGGTHNFSQITGLTGNLKSAIYCVNGAALINGSGTITIGGGRRSIRMTANAINIAPRLTIDSDVIMDLSSTALTSATNTGIILIENAAANTTCSITNKGTLNFTGARGNPIWMNNSAASTSITNFTNQGTISINGAFNEPTADISSAGIYMNGAVNALGNGNSFTNSGTIEFNTTMAGTSAKPLFLCAVSPVNLITNSGTITIGTNGAPPIAFRLGDGETTVNNTGTVTIGAGKIEGFVDAGNAAFNNNASGTLNFNLAAATSAISNNVTFANVGGTLKGSGTFTNTGGNIFSSGTIAPGQSPGKIILADAAIALNGTYNAEVDGTAGAGLPGGNDQIEASTAAATVNVTGLTIATTFSGGYTPVTGHIIVLIKANGGTITGTPTYSPALSPAWVKTTTGGEVKLTYNAALLAVELITFKATPLSKINVLTWATASETDNKGFDVERQTANGTWETLGFVKGTGKAATYTFEDKAPLSISYYRLRQIDFDGKETLSKVVSVRQDSKGRISITPNPTSDKVTINFNHNDVTNATTTIALFDMTGRQVLTQVTTSDAAQIDLSNLAKGVYLMKAQSNNAVYQEKIIRQ